MTLDAAAWFARGEGLGCFPDDGHASLYLAAYQNGDLAAVVTELERIFAGPARMPAVNWLGVPSIISAAETALEDGPRKLVEDYTPSDFEIRPWGGGTAGPALLASDSGWDTLLVDLLQSFIFLNSSDKVTAAGQYAAAVSSSYSLRPASLSALARAATAARFLQTAAPGSPDLQAAVPGWYAFGGMAAGLRARAAAVLLHCWGATIGAMVAGTPPYPITLYGLRSATTVLGVDSILAAVRSTSNGNVIDYLRCADFS
jgi:hypothetical protein